jgi:hypothetical protein
MVSIFLLILFIFYIGLEIGGGLYETLVIYPRWKKDPTPETLAQNLETSGQNAALRFWPFISPLSGLLSAINMVLALQSGGELKVLWFGAAFLIILKSVVTYLYFVPTMMRTFRRAETMDAKKLKIAVKLWTSLSPIRAIFEVVAWIMALWALLLLR